MDSIKKLYKLYNQDHVFKNFNLLSSKQKLGLINQLKSIDIKFLNNVFSIFRNKTNNNILDLKSLDTYDYFSIEKQHKEQAKLITHKNIGKAFIQSGKLAALTVAGGMGSRLGVNGPKGLIPVTPIKKKPLFQVFSEKIIFAQKKYNIIIPWLIMTSHNNHEQTLDFFKKENFFGLKIYFFKQDNLPALSPNGKIIMDNNNYSIYMVPNGHGGVFDALKSNKLFKVLNNLGIKLLSYFQVDNPLSHFIDPTFIGLHVENKSEMSSKFIKKEKTNEKLGAFCKCNNNKLHVIEYSNIPKNYIHSINLDLGNTGMHLINVDFAEKIANFPYYNINNTIPYHYAQKEIKLNNIKTNIIKLEKFIFDAFKLAKNPFLFEIDRKDEFSPIKNSCGNYSLKSCIDDQNFLFKKWMQYLNPNDSASFDNDFFNVNTQYEVSPLFADCLESFLESINDKRKKPSVFNDLYIE